MRDKKKNLSIGLLRKPLKQKKIQFVQVQLSLVNLKNHFLNFQEHAQAVVKHHILNY